MQFVPYLTFDGRCAEAFRFYEHLLGGRLEVQTHGESPIAADVPPDYRDLVLHARLTVGDQVLMGSDAPPEHRTRPQGFHVSIQVESAQEAERLWNGLSGQGSVTMPLQQTFWAERFGMCVDRYGIPWIVNSPQPSPVSAA